MVGSRKINLSLNPQVASFLLTLSSDQYASLAYELFTPGDMFYTFFFRYPRLIQSDIPVDNSTQGCTIDYTSHHPFVAFFVTLGVTAFACANFYREYSKQQRARLNNSYGFVHSELVKDAKTDTVLATLAPQIEAKAAEVTPALINTYLQSALHENKKLSEKYSSVKIENGELVFALKNDKAPQPAASESRMGKAFNFMVKKVLGPVWEFLSLSSFAYWLMWIGAGIMTGSLAIGISGMSLGLGFGIPIAVGLTYPLLKVIHWFQHRKSPAAVPADANAATEEETDEAKQDAVQVLRQALAYKRAAWMREKLIAELQDAGRAAANTPAALNQPATSQTLRARIESLKHGIAKKSIINGISDWLSSYVGAQYGAWIATDFLSKCFSAFSKFQNGVAAIPVVNAIGGWALFVISAGHAIYKGVTNYLNRSKTADDARALLARVQNAAADVSSLETILAEKRAYIEKWMPQLQANNQGSLPVMPVQFNKSQYFKDINRTGPTNATRWKKAAVLAMNFVNFFMTGIFIARLFIVKGTAILLPFAAAAFSNPVTIGLMVAIGVAVAAFKLYEYHMKRKEERTKAMLNQYEERISYLKQEVELADLTAQVVSLRIEKIEKNSAQPSAGTGNVRVDVAPSAQANISAVSTPAPTPA